MARLGQFRRDTLENWNDNNPILADGEFVLIASDSTAPKIYDYWCCGDGITPFIQLTKHKFNSEIIEDLLRQVLLALGEFDGDTILGILQRIETKVGGIQTIINKIGTASAGQPQTLFAAIEAISASTTDVEATEADIDNAFGE